MPSVASARRRLSARLASRLPAWAGVAPSPVNCSVTVARSGWTLRCAVAAVRTPASPGDPGVPVQVLPFR